jgi:hypothetical protein
MSVEPVFNSEGQGPRQAPGLSEGMMPWLKPIECSEEGCDEKWGIACASCGAEVCPSHYWETLNGGVCGKDQHKLAAEGEWDETVDEHKANCQPCRLGQPIEGPYAEFSVI